jgi:hypothetical protein
VSNCFPTNRWATGGGRGVGWGVIVVENLVERLAAMEHEQWAHWTRYMLDNLTPENIARWKRQIETPYQELSEREKESDRVWARKVLVAIEWLQEPYIRFIDNMEGPVWSCYDAPPPPLHKYIWCAILDALDAIRRLLRAAYRNSGEMVDPENWL